MLTFDSVKLQHNLSSLRIRDLKLILRRLVFKSLRKIKASAMLSEGVTFGCGLITLIKDGLRLMYCSILVNA
jgi:hypothetical protein